MRPTGHILECHNVHTCIHTYVHTVQSMEKYMYMHSMTSYVEYVLYVCMQWCVLMKNCSFVVSLNVVFLRGRG